MTLRRTKQFKYFFIASLIIVISVFHYQTDIAHRYLHEIYQRVYYIPIILAAFWFGPGKGLLAAFITSLIYVVHIQKDWTSFPVYSFNQYAEIVLYHLTAVIIGFLSSKEREQRLQLEKTSSELSDAYAQLQETFERLRRSDRLAALGQLSAGIAHEIRNPLGSIKGSVEILEASLGPGHSKAEFTEIIKEEVYRLNRLVEEFLKFARPPKPSIETVWMNDLITSTLVLIRKEAEGSEVRIKSNLDKTLPPLNLDPNQIRQVLLNIVLNGIQAMPDGGVLELRSFIEKESVIVSISDSGGGISAEQLESVFDPFFTTKPEGTGLGLSIAHQLVENHNGTVTANHNKSGGMTFLIRLPLKIPAG